MGEHARTLATRVIEEIDDQLRHLTQERDDATSALAQDDLDKSIQRRLQERIAWEKVLLEAGKVQKETDPKPDVAAASRKHKLAS
jgi:hypothetical protein